MMRTNASSPILIRVKVQEQHHPGDIKHLCLAPEVVAVNVEEQHP